MWSYQSMSPSPLFTPFPVSAMHWAPQCSTPAIAMPLSGTSFLPPLCTHWCPSEECCTPDRRGRWLDTGFYCPHTHIRGCHMHFLPFALGELDQTSSTGKEQRLPFCRVFPPATSPNRMAAEIGIMLISSSHSFLSRKTTKEQRRSHQHFCGCTGIGWQLAYRLCLPALLRIHVDLLIYIETRWATSHPFNYWQITQFLFYPLAP